MNELPESWEWSTVGEVTSVQLGRQRSPKNHSGPHMRPYLRSANVTWDGVDVFDVKEMNFDPDEAKTFELVDGDILLNEASGSPKEVGKPAIWRDEIPGACFQNTLLRVRSQGPDYKYLFWFFFASAYSGQFGEAGRGVNIRHLGKQGLTSFAIPVPPLPEQRRIVAAIEEHFSRLDAAEELLERVRRSMEALWRSISDSAFLAVTSEKEHLGGQAFSFITSGSRGWARYYSSNGAMFIRVGDIPRGGIRLDLSDVQLVSPPAGAEGRRTKAEPGDLLITITADVGRVAVFPPGLEAAYINQHVALARPQDGLNPDYLARFIASSTAQRQLGLLQRGATKAGLGLDDIRALRIPVPEVSRQRAIAEQLASEEERLELLARTLDDSGRRAKAMRRSVLAAAFSGQLVSQDSSDEPAAVLLERIAAERAASKPPRRKKAAS